MSENTFQLFPCDIVAPCESFQCYGRAEYFLGRRYAPKTTLKNVCAKCANELIDSILSAHKVNPTVDVAVEVSADPLPFEPEPEKELTLKELKAAAKAAGLSGYSDKNRDELITMLENA